ncbi:MAG: hypothetical protein A2687_01610 [Candidatus Levybacteria bacterium RIFCSPHIGHO2_01_FULL_38_26]|nr:MAG: hypothetical protein A2687_01610 [Candidatus Levybacteria bacterium RIFCSPHIGHO2_01_FULL_38_26]
MLKKNKNMLTPVAKMRNELSIFKNSPMVWLKIKNPRRIVPAIKKNPLLSFQNNAATLSNSFFAKYTPENLITLGTKASAKREKSNIKETRLAKTP